MPTLRKQIISYVSEECTPDEFMKHVNDVKLYVDLQHEGYEIDVYAKSLDHTPVGGMQERIFSLPINRELYVVFLHDDSDEKLMEYVKNNLPESVCVTIRG